MLFIPADNKLEAVARISRLTNSGPETLGPGSKERKSVVFNLANGLGVEIDISDTKQEIARSIASFLGCNWSGDCESVGQTLTLKGLNLLLEGANHFLDSEPRQNVPKTFSDELSAISEVVIRNTPARMDGQSCVKEMRDAEYRHWKQTEWQGFYFEFKVCPALINALGGGPKTVLNTEFDYALTNTWDLKTHSSVDRHARSNHTAQLNDQEAIQIAVEEGGLGLIVLSGIPTLDLDFALWHKSFRGNTGDTSKPLKKYFQSERIDFFFLESRIVLDSAIKSGVISDFKQGKQQSGKARRPKYNLNVEKALDSDIHVKSHLFT